MEIYTRGSPFARIGLVLRFEFGFLQSWCDSSSSALPVHGYHLIHLLLGALDWGKNLESRATKKRETCGWVVTRSASTRTVNAF